MVLISPPPLPPLQDTVVDVDDDDDESLLVVVDDSDSDGERLTSSSSSSSLGELPQLSEEECWLIHERRHHRELKEKVGLLRKFIEGDGVRRVAQRKSCTVAKFWSANISGKPRHHFLSVLKPVIIGYCGAVATSTSSESAFSVAGAVKSKHHSSLSSQHLRMETIISRNLHLFDSEEDFIVQVLRAQDE
jgi:hypothetical protein